MAGSGGGPVKVWSLCSSKLVHDLRGHAAGVLCHQQSGTLLATGAADCALRLWDLRVGKAQAVVPLGSLPYCLQVGRVAAMLLHSNVPCAGSNYGLQPWAHS